MATTRSAARTADGGRRLVIVESPAKAKTIAGYLGPGWVVESSIGHIRDLPSGASEVPASYKGKSWARLGVDVDNGFAPLYVVSAGKKAQVGKLKAALKEADELYLATDEDREGEAIAWHLLQELKPRVPVRRMVFHEITPQAIRDAVTNPREIDQDLVDAQETRRILDRLYGYEVSPVLWKKVLPRLSAGRVQSVATRIIVEREQERIAFRSAGYWDLEAVLDTGRPATATDPAGVTATLSSLDGARIAVGRDFDATGTLVTDGVRRLDEAGARQVAEGLLASARPPGVGGPDAPPAGRVRVSRVDERPYRRSPYAPFITSTLQQEAGRKLRFASAHTMRVAQRLYESGYITYMRTDSTTLSQTALAAARDQARRLYGDQYVPRSPRTYDRKVKNAQEAHEAIRPAGETFRTPQEVAGELARDEQRLYELIWMRTVASQMADATGQSVSVRFAGVLPDRSAVELAASGKTIAFPGFLRAYVEGSDDPDAELEDRERRLPALAVGDLLTVAAAEPKAHETSPPARYTESSLVKRLEELGVGRPSTYASIISTIVDRGYVTKRGQALVPTFTAFAVVNLLQRHFTTLVDYAFTARMEDGLDEIASGQRQQAAWLTDFYFGSGQTLAADGRVADGAGGAASVPGPGLHRLVTEGLDDIDAREVNSIPVGVDAAGREIVVRVGRYGPYLQRDDERTDVPDTLAPDELTVQVAEQLLARPTGDKILGTDPVSGRDVLARQGRYGPYVTLALPEGETAPARSASLLPGMELDALSLDDALRLLSLPRVLGTDPATGEEVVATNGRYGPYVKRGKETRSLPGAEQIFTVTLDEALALLAAPKGRRGRGGAEGATVPPPLRELGTDPVSGKPVVLREGRYGPYVSDGETNASLRREDDPATVTLERAGDLLAERRARGPATPRRSAGSGRATGGKGAAGTGRARTGTRTGTGTGTGSGTGKRSSR